MSESAGEKTQEATPQRVEEAKKEGRFARSRDISAVACTAAVLGLMLGSRDAFSRSVEILFARCHGDLSALSRGDGGGVVSGAVGVLAVTAAPAAVVAAVVAATSGLAQSGGTINPNAFTLNLDRLNPFANLQQLLSPVKGSTEVLMGLLRVGVVGYVVYRALTLELPMILGLSYITPSVGGQLLMGALVRIVTSALVALGGIATLDYVKSRMSIARDLRMSRQEIKDESRSRDGDPKMKGRMRARARAAARKRSLANVKTATVVVSNPTHISVALRYSAADPAPIVVSKGHDEVALQIRAEARKHGIPILENRLLARALDAEVPLGHPVPSVHFAAVARVLAFVFRLRGVPGTRRAS